MLAATSITSAVRVHFRFCALTTVLLAACAPRGEPVSRAQQILAGAQRAIGASSDTVRNVWAMAAVTAPGGNFETRVASARDGRVRMSLGKNLVAGVNHGAGWRCDSLGKVGTLDSVTRTVVRGHDLHMLALSASTWLSDPVVTTPTRWGADSVLAVQFNDEMHAPLTLYVRVTDTLPVGAHVINHTGEGPRDVSVYFDAWEQRAGLRLFRKAVFVHGDNRFEYDYKELSINTLADSVFVPMCQSKTNTDS